MPVQQIIEDRYVDRRRLQALLARKFLPGTYSITWKLNRWIINAPEALTDSELDDLTI